MSGIVGKHGANCLGTGMHPLLRLEDTGVWSHYHKKIYSEYAKIFNLTPAWVAKYPELPP